MIDCAASEGYRYTLQKGIVKTFMKNRKENMEARTEKTMDRIRRGGRSDEDIPYREFRVSKKIEKQ
jgi:hypothetical protein